MECKCPRCDQPYLQGSTICPSCLAPLPPDTVVWPPHPTGTRVIRIECPEDETVENAINFGRKFCLLCFVMPTMFAPFAIYYGSVAIRNGQSVSGWRITATALAVVLVYAGLILFVLH